MQESAGDADAHGNCDSGPASYTDAACYAVHATPALSNRNAHAAAYCYPNGDGNTPLHADATPCADIDAPS